MKHRLSIYAPNKVHVVYLFVVSVGNSVHTFSLFYCIWVKTPLNAILHEKIIYLFRDLLMLTIG